MDRNTDLTDYSSIRKHCEVAGRITADLIDGYLVSFAAKRYDLEKKMEQQFNRYRHVFSKFKKQEVNLFKSQYLAHLIFKEGGLLERILKHPALIRMSDEEREYLVRQTEIPWRFSFSEIVEQPAKDFFRMRDVFTGDEYLLFSRGTSQIIDEGPKLLWLNLIGHNGACWQSFGPIGAFQSFDSDDVFFFATEKNPDIEDDLDVQEDVEADPLPYILLVSGAAYPRTVSKGFETVFMMTEFESEPPESAGMKKKFTVEYHHGVYRYTHKKLGEFPHFARIYYDEKEKILLFQTMTEHGFIHLVRDFNSLGYDLEETPFSRVRPQMVTMAESILKRKVVIDEYDHLFSKDPDPHTKENTDRMNEFVGLIMPALNAGREPDILEAARKTGLDPETAATLMKSVRKIMTKYDKPHLPGKTNEMLAGQSPQKLPPFQSPVPLSVPSSIPFFDKQADRYVRIYTVARQIGDLEPWRDLYETDNFGVRLPGSDLTWYISVMGNSGEYTAIAAYRGVEGFSGFHRLQENAGIFQGMELMTIPHLLISFTDREALNKEDLAAIKKSGVTFRGKGKWIQIEEVIPGLVPDYPGEETLNQLPGLLEQVFLVLQKVNNNPRLLKGGRGGNGKILVRVPKISAGLLQWEDRYENLAREDRPVVYKPVWSPKSAGNVSKLKSRQVTLQCDLTLLPAPVKMEGKKGYFPFVLLLVDKESGMISGSNLLSPLPDLPSMYETFPQKLLEAILKLGFLPARLEFRSELLFNLAEEILKQAGIPLTLTDHMPQVDEALESLFNNLGK